MIYDISDAAFKHLLNDERLFLPIRWEGSDYATALDNHYKYYIKAIENNSDEFNEPTKNLTCRYEEIKMVCAFLVQAVEEYLNGFPARAYNTFGHAMNILIGHPLKVYEKSITELFGVSNHKYEDELDLYRIVRVSDNRPYPRRRVFHTPYNMRSLVSGSRFSIAGYPSLYLATSLQLCCQELHIDPYQDLAIASLFKLERNLEFARAHINVIELAVKPQDFLMESNDNYINKEYPVGKRHISNDMLKKDNVKEAYMLWYPLIAACSFIRTNQSAPFSAEFIVPQLLMQWVRSNNTSDDRRHHRLTGIRYFSCSSMIASNMGFNYVFPTSGQQISPDLPFCSVLGRAFRLTLPVYINEYYPDYQECERYLKRKGDLDYIDAK